MPKYLYDVIDFDGNVESRIELEHAMSSSPLKIDPKTGKKLKKVYTIPYLGSQYSGARTKKMLTKENIEKKGFSRFEKDKLTGKYHKTAGPGPQTIEA